jgi:hypothetical protein
MSSDSDYVNISNKYAPSGASSTKAITAVVSSSKNNNEIETAMVSSTTDNRKIEIENQKYGSAKPRRILVRAGIIHDQG